MQKKHQTLIDNGLFGAITRKGHYDKYVRFCEGVDTFVGSVGNCELIVTPSSLLEAVGITLPSISISPEKNLVDRATQSFQKKSDDLGNRTNDLRLDILGKYEHELSKLENLTLKRLNESLERQLEYVSTELREWFYQTFAKNIRDEEAREFLVNRLALDRMYAHKYPTELVSIMDTTTIMDVVESMKLEHNIPQSRGLEKTWHSFKKYSVDYVRKEMKNPGSAGKQTITTNLTFSEIVNNIRMASRCFRFKSNSDLLDVEFVHYLTVGRHVNGCYEKVYGFTAEPTGKVRIRLQMMKSFLSNSKDIMAQYDKTDSTKNIIFNGGFLGFFDLHGKLQSRADVDQEPSLFDRMLSERIEIA